MPRARLQPKPAATPVQPQALTIIQFCEAFGISEAFYYKLKRQGIGPKEMKLGTRILISMEAAAQWRTERENAAEQG